MAEERGRRKIRASFMNVTSATCIPKRAKLIQIRDVGAAHMKLARVTLSLKLVPEIENGTVLCYLSRAHCTVWTSDLFIFDS